MDTSPPDGLTGFEPMSYNYKRWNGITWPNIQVDAYNWELARIESRHNSGMNVQPLIDGLYNLARGFDTVGR